MNSTDAGRLRLNDISFKNFTLLNNNVVILNYTYSFIQLFKSILENINCTNYYNVHDNTSSAYQSTTMIIIKETGIDSECKNTYLHNDMLPVTKFFV